MDDDELFDDYMWGYWEYKCRNDAEFQLKAIDILVDCIKCMRDSNNSLANSSNSLVNSSDSSDAKHNSSSSNSSDAKSIANSNSSNSSNSSDAKHRVNERKRSKNGHPCVEHLLREYKELKVKPKGDEAFLWILLEYEKRGFQKNTQKTKGVITKYLRELVVPFFQKTFPEAEVKYDPKLTIHILGHRMSDVKKDEK